MDKLKKYLYINKKVFVFLISLSIIGVVFGSLLPIFLSEGDKNVIGDYITSFVGDIKNTNSFMNVFINSIVSNFGFTILVWLLGVSIIGVPIVLVMFFSKCFVLGFSISSIIINYGFKGCLFGFLYAFPLFVLYIFIYAFLTNYSLIFSFRFIFYITNKFDFNLKSAFNKYFMKLCICLCFVLVCCLYETFALPYVLNFVFKFLGI